LKVSTPFLLLIVYVYEILTIFSEFSRSVQVLFWDQALDRSIKEQEAQSAGDSFNCFAQTPLPPRGLAVTRDNHLVICTAEDCSCGEGTSKNCVLKMTMRGDVVASKIMDMNTGATAKNGCYFPR
jgi:hypothetical protein